MGEWVNKYTVLNLKDPDVLAHDRDQTWVFLTFFFVAYGVCLTVLFLLMEKMSWVIQLGLTLLLGAK